MNSQLVIGNRILGEGAYGRVVAGTSNNESVAIKISTQSSSILYKEADISARTISDYVMKILGYSQGTPASENFPFIIMPMAAEDVKTMMEKKGLNFDKKISFMRKVAEGLNCLHSNGILHLDLKPVNVLVNLVTRTYKGTDFIIREPMVADFGLSVNVSSISQGIIKKFTGTPLVSSPDKVKNWNRYYQSIFNYTYADDVWSYGILFAYVLKGEYIIDVDVADNMPQFEAISYIINSINKFINAMETALEAHVPPEKMELVVDLLSNCLRMTNDERPYFNEILEHELFSNILTPIEECRTKQPPGIILDKNINLLVTKLGLLYITTMLNKFFPESSLRVLFHSYDMFIRYMNLSSSDFEIVPDKNQHLLILCYKICDITLAYDGISMGSVRYSFGIDSSVIEDVYDKVKSMESRILRKLAMILYRRHLFESLSSQDISEIGSIFNLIVNDIDWYLSFVLSPERLLSDDTLENVLLSHVKISVLDPYNDFISSMRDEFPDISTRIFNIGK